MGRRARPKPRRAGAQAHCRQSPAHTRCPERGKGGGPPACKQMGSSRGPGLRHPSESSVCQGVVRSPLKQGVSAGAAMQGSDVRGGEISIHLHTTPDSSLSGLGSMFFSLTVFLFVKIRSHCEALDGLHLTM